MRPMILHFKHKSLPIKVVSALLSDKEIKMVASSQRPIMPVFVLVCSMKNLVDVSLKGALDMCGTFAVFDFHLHILYVSLPVTTYF